MGARELREWLVVMSFFAFRSWVWLGVMRAVSVTLIPPPPDTRSAVHHGNEEREEDGRVGDGKGNPEPLEIEGCTQEKV